MSWLPTPEPVPEPKPTKAFATAQAEPPRLKRVSELRQCGARVGQRETDLHEVGDAVVVDPRIPDIVVVQACRHWGGRHRLDASAEIDADVVAVGIQGKRVVVCVWTDGHAVGDAVIADAAPGSPGGIGIGLHDEREPVRSGAVAVTDAARAADLEAEERAERVVVETA